MVYCSCYSNRYVKKEVNGNFKIKDNEQGEKRLLGQSNKRFSTLEKGDALSFSSGLEKTKFINVMMPGSKASLLNLYCAISTIHKEGI